MGSPEILLLKLRLKILSKEEGAYKLHNIYDQLNLTMPTSAASHTNTGAVLIPLGCQSDDDEAAGVAVKYH